MHPNTLNHDIHHSSRRIGHLLLRGGLIATVLYLAACAPAPTRPTISPIDAPHADATRPDPRVQLREYDTKAAAAKTPDQKAWYQLLAMELLMDYGRTDNVRERLDKFNLRALNRNEHYRVDLLIAQLALAGNNAPQALQKLPKNNPAYPPAIQANILRTRAIALSRLGYLSDSLNIRLRLDHILAQLPPDKAYAISANHQVIWSILQTMPEDALQAQLAAAEKDSALQGWIELIRNIRAATTSGLSRDLAVDNWIARFPRHPAVDTLGKTLRSQRELLSEYPNNLALLLPLTGRYAPQAKATRDGFLTAYYTHDSGRRPSVRIYDTGDDPGRILEHYQTAVQEGADMIVGPLEKEAVSALVKSRNLGIPVLALNYAEDDKAFSPGIVQFGLRPEDEARQAAELAIIKDQTKAIVFAPNNNFGERLTDAFAQRYTELGGKVLVVQKYSPNTDDHRDPIQRALNILQSNTRDSILRSVLKAGLKFEPRRREDVDAIFLIANPQHTRNFRSQLKFFNSGDVSVYASSQSYGGIVDKGDRDSDGVVFTDMPWTLQGSTNSNFARIAEHWPRSLQRFPRIYALGLDAYRILPQLARLRANPHERFPGLTGSISLDYENRIHRELLWATFSNGRATVLEFASVEDHNLFDPEDDISYLQSP